MDMQCYYNQFENCLQEEKPYCSDGCPFNIDVLDFMDKLAKGRYSAAYKTLRNAVGFPDIVARLCPQYCQAHCPRKESGGAIEMSLLEKTCIARTKKKDPNEYNMPAKKGRVAVIGAGISGLACALRVASKKYDVTIFEKTDRIGGQLHDLMPEEFFMEDIQRQFKFEEYTLMTNTEIKDLRKLSEQGFDAVYIATGKGGYDFGVMDEAGSHCRIIDGMGVFAGGSLTGSDVISSMADGLAIAWPIEGYLKTGNIQYIEKKPKTRVVANVNDVNTLAPAIAGDDGILSEVDMEYEVSRCLRCQCNSCMHYCDLTDYFNKWPLQMRDEIMTTTMPADSMIHKTPAIKLINACTQCGLCNEGCPGNIQLGEMIKEARRCMHSLGRMPGAYHQFWVRDMEFANGEYAALSKKAPCMGTCSQAFFPGCHLGAAEPLYVIKSYEWLLSVKPDTGLLLQCCGVPADWAGNEEMHEAEIENLREKWESFGSPKLIMACASCMRHIKENLPEIPVISLYEVMEQYGIEPKENEEGKIYSVFDPCAAGNESDMQDAVRSLAAKAGAGVEEMPGGVKQGCCGFGGNIEEANPKFAGKVAKKRAEIIDNPYITYCINCRDVFFDEGKPARHILDIMLGIQGPADRLPTVTEQRCNRVVLKERLLEEIWGEDMIKPPELKYELIISDEIRDKLNRLRILEEDICHVLEAGEEYGRRALDPAKETYKCYRELGYITCWVEYKKSGECYEILNVYTHRMKIELEAVWNGRKTETNLR